MRCLVCRKGSLQYHKVLVHSHELDEEGYIIRGKYISEHLDESINCDNPECGAEFDVIEDKEGSPKVGDEV